MTICFLSRPARYGLAACLLVAAATPVLADETKTLNVSSYTSRLIATVDTHPRLVSERATLRSKWAQADAKTKPLYNPVIGADLEREGKTNNYAFNISQTFDFWGKRSARQDQSVFMQSAAAQSYIWRREQRQARALLALIEHAAETKRSQLQQDQETQLQQLIGLIKTRQDAGDLGPVDVELALYSLSQKLLDASAAAVKYQQSGSRLDEILPNWQTDIGLIPPVLWSSLAATASDINLHPRVLAAIADQGYAERQVEIAKKTKKADPSFGIQAGKNNGDKLVGLSFTMPLNLRNNFKAEVKAATETAYAMAARKNAVYREQLAKQTSARQTLAVLKEKLVLWQSLIPRSTNKTDLLQRRWQAGDLNTSSYLIALQARMEARLAEVTLNQTYRNAVIQTLLQSGQLGRQLAALSSNGGASTDAATDIKSIINDVNSLVEQES